MHSYRAGLRALTLAGETVYRMERRLDAAYHYHFVIQSANAVASCRSLLGIGVGLQVSRLQPVVWIKSCELHGQDLGCTGGGGS